MPEHGPVLPHEGSDDYVFPPIAHSGYDGNSTFTMPLATNLTDVTWEVEDPTIAVIAPTFASEELSVYGKTWGMVTTLKPGTTKVFAISGTRRAEATIVVSAYQPADVAAGRKRYYEPDNASGPGRTACVDCHGQIQTGADHSPLEIEFFSDADVITAIVDGQYPDGYVLQNVNHVWNLTEAERVGIVPYLRTLSPTGFF